MIWNLLINKTTLKFAILLAMVGSIVTLGCLVGKYKNDADRYKNNQIALMTDLENYKTENGKNAARVMELEMTSKEFKELCSEQSGLIKDMGLSIKRLELASTTVTETHVSGETTLYDTVVYVMNDTVEVPEKVKYFQWSDPWNKISGVINDDKVNCDYSGIDTLTIAVTKVPKKFLFFKWGCKYLEVNLMNQNPSNKVTYNRTVKIK